MSKVSTSMVCTKDHRDYTPTHILLFLKKISKKMQVLWCHIQPCDKLKRLNIKISTSKNLKQNKHSFTEKKPFSEDSKPWKESENKDSMKITVRRPPKTRKNII